MNLHQSIMYDNNCYKAGRTIKPKGIMVHSTGVNNPTLKRYVGPDDGLLGYNNAQNFWNRPGVYLGVHAFIGKLKDGSIATYQTLPWNWRAWHAGTAYDGGPTANDTHLSFEICEDSTNDPVYFKKVYYEAVDLCAFLCKEYDLDPMDDIICHSEGYKMRIASNHADVMHWFPKHGKTMDTFRAEVKEKMEDEDMSYDKFKEYMAQWTIELNAKPVSEWAEEDWAFAKSIGYFDGSRPQAPLTRQEAAILFRRENDGSLEVPEEIGEDEDRCEACMIGG